MARRAHREFAKHSAMGRNPRGTLRFGDRFPEFQASETHSATVFSGAYLIMIRSFEVRLGWGTPSF